MPRFQPRDHEPERICTNTLYSLTDIYRQNIFRFRENAKRLSGIYLDQPLTPLQQAVYWTEYVIRHKGAPHMRSAALDLTWYQYFLIDVITVFAVFLGTILLIVLLVLRALLRKIFESSDKKQIASSKKKRN